MALDYMKLTPALVRHYVTPFKGRTVKLDEAVEVYRNLNNKTHRYSMRQNGLVVGHMNEIMLKDVTFHVSIPGWKRSLRDGQRNVHAFARGLITPSGMGTNAENAVFCPIRYDLTTGMFLWGKYEVKGAMVAAFNGRGAGGAYMVFR